MDHAKTDAEVLEHISVIAEELNQVIPPKEMCEFSIPDAESRTTRQQIRAEARIVELASTVANAKYTSKMYSNFHEWEAFRHISTKAEAHALAPDLIASMHPFGNCLTMAFECCEELRAAIAAEGPTYAGYVDRVQLVTNNRRQRARSSRDYHCITIVRLRAHCIVIDAIALNKAFLVPLDGLCRPPGCSSQGFIYVASGNMRLLVEYEPNMPCYTLARPQSKGLFEYDDPYADIRGGLAGAAQDLMFPSVNWHLQGTLPSRRTIMVHQTWNRKPRSLGVAFEELLDENGFVVETCQVRVNFQKRKMTVRNIPFIDCLTEYEALLRQLRGCDRVSFPTGGNAFAKFKIVLVDQGTGSFDGETMRNLALMNEMCEYLGMPEGEILRIADIMLEVWVEHDERRSK